MATLGNDCYFFCTSTCAKGAACPFRHVEAAKTCRIICQHWQMGACLRPMCKFRHSDFIVDTSEVPCYWESQPAGCKKQNCPYKHSKPALQDEKTVIGAVSLQDPTAGTSSNSEDIKSQNIVQPVVTSATQPSFDSEKTSSSQRSPTLQESEIQVNTDKQKTESDDSKDSNADSIQNISVEPQKSKVTTKKIKVSPVSKMKQKSATTMKKKRKENDADSIAGIFTRKVNTIAKKNLHQPRKSIKERLGRAPVSRPVVSHSPEESDSESGSESDDSIENIKVMSVEEILRQKALESMMKKRAGEGRTKQRGASFAVIKEQTSLPSADKKMYPALDRETRTLQKNVQNLERRSKTYVTTTKKVKHVPAAVNRSSSSSSEESDSSDENKAIKQLSESSSDTSDSLAASSSSDTDENSTDSSEELDIRRVVVDLESEKAARKKAKESFMKKQNQNAINTQDSIRKGRVIKRLPRQAKASAVEMTENREQHVKKRYVNVDYDSDDFICSRVQEPLKLHVRDRLGKSTSLHKANSDARLLSKTEKFGSEVVSTKVDSSKVIPVRILRVSKSNSSEDEQTPLKEVKVKTLEEIRLEKMKIMAQKREQKFSTQEGGTDIQTLVSAKNRLGAPPGKMQKREVVHSEARQVVLLNGTKCDDTTGIKPSDEQKKTKKRPWRTVRPKTNPSAIDAIANDERTSIVSSPSLDRDDYSVELDHHMDVHVADESSFERLRRRALMKKLQAKESKRFKKSTSVEEVKTVDDDSEKPEFSQVVDTSTSVVKTHKHKHGHKHKNVKTERKIYLPPAMKSAASKSSLISESLSSKQALTMAPAPNVSPLKREPHPIAAAWTAGLAVSSKGMSVRRLETINKPAGNVEISSRIKVPEQLGDIDRSKEIVSSSKMPESSVTIKSFAEIMAEKRKRRLEMQAQKAGTADLTAAASVATSSLEPSMIYSSSASSVLPANSYPLKSAISHQSMDVKPTSSLVSDQSSVISKTVMQAGKASKQSLMTTTKEVIPEMTNVLVSRVSSSAPVAPSSTPSPQGLVKSVGQKVKLKSSKKNHAEGKKKNQKVFTKRNDIQQSSQSCIVTSENSGHNFLSSSSYPDKSTLSQTVTSSTDNTMLHVGSNKTSHPTHKPVSASAIETSSQLFQNIATTGLNMADNESVSTLPIHINSPNINEQTYSSKQSVAVLKEESEHARKNARLSLEDEFSFFEDEDMVFEDTSILENIEPIDNLLQDIDDLLS